jgi:mxaJ protein
MRGGAGREHRVRVVATGAHLAIAVLGLCSRAGDARRAASPPPHPPAGPAPLRVCADPNNLPFSNRRGEGFENRIAQLLAAEWHRPLQYTWWPERRGFVRHTLGAGACDVVLGIVEGDPLVRTTAPYYRSTYVFVYRRDRPWQIRSLDDPRLRRLRIGIHVIGDDYNALPPGVALARRGIVRNVIGYSIYGDYSQETPPARLIEAVAAGDVDVAIAWGPLAGYVAARAPVPLAVVPVTPRLAMPGMPFEFAIAFGVRRADTALATALDRFLAARRGAIHDLLRSYHIPLIPAPGTGAAPSRSAATARTSRCPAPREEATCD